LAARLIGFSAPEATLMMRTGANAVFERVPLAGPADSAAFVGMLFHLDQPIDYYVEAGGVRSPMFSVTLVDLPTVRQLDLEYHYPSYRPGAAEGRKRRRRRGSARHRGSRPRRTDDGDAGWADRAQRERIGAARAAA